VVLPEATERQMESGVKKEETSNRRHDAPTTGAVGDDLPGTQVAIGDGLPQQGHGRW
jgi:hypothetical protein